MHQFDYVCKMTIKHEFIDIQRKKKRQRRHEVLFSELSEEERKKCCYLDEYSVENSHFFVLGYDIEVKDSLLAEALLDLSEKKRNVILLYYYIGMTDDEIAREMKLVRSTIHEHRKRSLEILQQKMKGYVRNEKGKKSGL